MDTLFDFLVALSVFFCQTRRSNHNRHSHSDDHEWWVPSSKTPFRFGVGVPGALVETNMSATLAVWGWDEWKRWRTFEVVAIIRTNGSRVTKQRATQKDKQYFWGTLCVYFFYYYFQLLSAPCFFQWHTLLAVLKLWNICARDFIASASTAWPFYFVDENLFTVFLFLIFIVAITALFKFSKWMSRLYFRKETKFWC